MQLLVDVAGVTLGGAGVGGGVGGAGVGGGVGAGGGGVGWTEYWPVQHWTALRLLSVTQAYAPLAWLCDEMCDPAPLHRVDVHTKRLPN